MKSVISVGIAASLLAVSANSFAESKLQLGGGLSSQSATASYIVISSQPYLLDYTYSNDGLFADGRYVMNDYVALDMSVALGLNGETVRDKEQNGLKTTTSSEIAGFRSTYISANLLVGMSLIRHGWYGYTGLGYFTDTWSADNMSSASFSGVQLPLGFGYNFSNVTVDAQVLFQSSDDYDKFFERELKTESDAAVVSFRLGLLANF